MPENFPVPRPPRAVLFDLDGVLVDTFDAWVAVLDECRARRGLPPLGPDPVRETWGQGILADCESFFPGEDPARLALEYDLGFKRHLHRVRLQDGAREVLEALVRAEIPAAVVTNSPRGLTERILRDHGVLDLFAVLACGDEVPRGKPDPAVVRLALERLGTGPAGAVLVGDTDLDVAAGHGARIPVVGFRIHGGDARVDAMGELPPLLGVPGA